MHKFLRLMPFILRAPDGGGDGGGDGNANGGEGGAVETTTTTAATGSEAAAATGSDDGSLIDLAADAGGEGAEATTTAATGDTVEIDVGGNKIAVPKAVADELTGLRESAAQAAEPKAPEGDYALTVPEDLAKSGIVADTNDPLVAPVSEWARKHDISQEAFDELTAIHYAREAAGAKDIADFQADQRKALIDAYNDGGRLSDVDALKKASDAGRWITGLLSADLKKEPAFLDELKVLTQTATGVRVLDTLRARIGETAVGGGADGGAEEQAMTTEDYYREMFANAPNAS